MLLIAPAVGRQLAHLVETSTEALEQPPVKPAVGGRERVVLPESVPPHVHEARPAQVSEVARHGCLGSPENGNEVSHADLPVVFEEMKDSQPGAIREGPEHAIDANGGHVCILGGQKGVASNEASILRLAELGFSTRTSV